MNTINPTYIVVGLFSTAILLASCGTEQQMDPELSTTVVIDSNKIQAVEVVKPQQRSFTAEVLITGTAQPNQKVILYAMESGYVKSINKDIGDVVKEGEVIAELSNPELSRLYEENNAQLNSKLSTYQRLKSIHDKTPALTTIQMLEDAEADYLTLNAKVKGLAARLSFLQASAPFAGIVTRRMVDNGALVQSGLTQTNPQGIVELQDISPIRLTVPLPETDVASVGKGMEAIVSFPELSGESYNVKVSRTAGVLDPASKTMQVEIDIDNPKGIIKPGMYAKVLMQLSSREGVISLPITALWIFKNQPFILVVKDNKVERIPLRRGLSSKDYFEILNSEITANSLVIVQGKGLVKPGQIVKPVLKSE